MGHRPEAPRRHSSALATCYRRLTVGLGLAAGRIAACHSHEARARPRASNKGMKLTSVERIGRSQLILGVRPTVGGNQGERVNEGRLVGILAAVGVLLVVPDGARIGMQASPPFALWRSSRHSECYWLERLGGVRVAWAQCRPSPVFLASLADGFHVFKEASACRIGPWTF